MASPEHQLRRCGHGRLRVRLGRRCVAVEKLCADEHVSTRLEEFERFHVDPRSVFTLLPPPASLLPLRSVASVAPVTRGGRRACDVVVRELCADEQVWTKAEEIEVLVRRRGEHGPNESTSGSATE